MHANQIAILLACLVCAGNGRRVQVSTGPPKRTPQINSHEPLKVADARPISFVQLEQSVGQAAATGKVNPLGKMMRKMGGVKKLTYEEITEKLNYVPAFAIVDTAGKLIPLSVKESPDQKFICWFTDAESAHAMLNMTNGQEGADGDLKLSVYPLTTMLELSNGLPAKKGQEDSEVSSVTFKSCDASKLNQELASALAGQLQAQGIEHGGWVLPVFFNYDFSTKKTLPVYFSIADFAEEWTQAGLAADQTMLNNLQVEDLRVLVHEMMNTDAFNWRIVDFVSSPEAYKLTEELSAV